MIDDKRIMIQRHRQLLRDSDWTELPSNQARKSDAWKAAWAEYRQALRDMDLENITHWPARPTIKD